MQATDDAATLPLKGRVRDFWNSEPCGSRYVDGPHDFAAQARARYELEPYILDFADFTSARGKRVLEIGVGIGADYLQWLQAGARVTGIDLSQSSLQQARRRCELAGYTPDLQEGDAENLHFESDSFDLVYSYGVMHHSADVQRCIDEAWRILKPGGRARIMLYHHPSLTGIMLWLRFGFLRRQSLRQAVFENLESYGTKTFSKPEIHRLMAHFEGVTIRQVFSPGDLLLHKPSMRFRSRFYGLVWRLYPRWLVRIVGRRFGLFLLISAGKPSAAKSQAPG